jgi:hypothetical protein
MNSATIVQKLWNYCNVLRDDGISYGDCVEQLTPHPRARRSPENCQRAAGRRLAQRERKPHSATLRAPSARIRHAQPFRW